MKQAQKLMRFTWPKFVCLLAVVIAVSVLQGWMRRTTFEGFDTNFNAGEVPKVPADSLWAEVSAAMGVEPKPAIDPKQLTPQNCRIINDAYLAEDEKSAETWHLAGAREACLMRYGEYAPETKMGVNQYEPDEDQPFYTGKPSPL